MGWRALVCLNESGALAAAEAQTPGGAKEVSKRDMDLATVVR